MNLLEVDGRIMTLEKQRNDALSSAVILGGKCNMLIAQNKELEERVKELEEQLEKLSKGDVV